MNKDRAKISQVEAWALAAKTKEFLFGIKSVMRSWSMLCRSQQRGSHVLQRKEWKHHFCSTGSLCEGFTGRATQQQ